MQKSMSLKYEPSSEPLAVCQAVARDFGGSKSTLTLTFCRAVECETITLTFCQAVECDFGGSKFGGSKSGHDAVVGRFVCTGVPRS